MGIFSYEPSDTNNSHLDKDIKKMIKDVNANLNIDDLILISLK